MQMAPWFPRYLSGVWMEEIARPACSGLWACLREKDFAEGVCGAGSQSPPPDVEVGHIRCPPAQ